MFNLILIFLIGSFAIQNLNLMLTKFRFIEIADDLNVAFLEMRLSEKNYFLYHDENALLEIQSDIESTMKIMNSVKNDIVRAIDIKQYNTLGSYLKSYAGVVGQIMKHKARDKKSEWSLRAEGKKLKEYSDRITREERIHISEIIYKSKQILFYSFFAILLIAAMVNRVVSKMILRSIKEIENMAKSISSGNFKKIKTSPPKDELGSIIHAINAMSDELKNREEELIQSKKLASIGILIAGVAHEINNPLNNISMVAQTYMDLYEKLTKEQRIEFMEKVEIQTERIKTIVNNLLDFAKPKEPTLIMTDMSTLIRQTLKLVQNMLEISNIETELDLAQNLPLVYVDVHQMQQVLVNIIVNAIQAMSTHGILSINTRFSKKDNIVETDIKDTGKGIPVEFLPHLFDPFFSTKDEGGTGLGLWVSYGIIKKHDGSIKVESSPGSGTVFTIQLPILSKKGAANE